MGLMILTGSLPLAAQVIKIDDILYPVASGSVRMQGYLGEKLDLCIQNRVVVQDVDRILEPFTTKADGAQGFRCEFWGKWFTSAMLGYAYQPSKEYKTVIDKAVKGLISTQAEDGYIGTYKDEGHLGTWDVWGRKYVLLGLIANYRQTGDPGVLRSAVAAADHLIAEAGPESGINLAETGWVGWKGLAPSSVLEPIIALYKITGDRDYLEFGEHIVQLWDKPNKLTPNGIRLIQGVSSDTPLWELGGAPKGYEMMSCFEGLCELYRVTGERKYFDACEALVDRIIRDELMIVGSATAYEIWFNGRVRQTEVLHQAMETCVTVTWMKLLYQMLRLTGDSKYADEFEKSLYNALLSSMTPRGEWWAYYNSLQGERCVSHQQYTDVGLSCCVANGPRALLLVPQVTYMTGKEGPVINLYAPSSATLSLPSGNELTLLQETGYPAEGMIKITVRPDRKEKFPLRLRIPGWSANTTLKVNGEPLRNVVRAGTYAVIERYWSKGDVIELNLDMRGRAVKSSSGVDDMALTRGPLVLSFDSRLVPERRSGFEPPLYRYKFDADPQGLIDVRLEEINSPDGIYLTFSVPLVDEAGGKHTLPMCDFCSAGNLFAEGNIFRVWVQQPFDMRHLYTLNLNWRANSSARERPVIPKEYRIENSPE